MNDETKEKIISYILESYKKGAESGRSAGSFGIDYHVPNFGTNIEDQSYSLPKKYLEERVGEELSEQIKTWAGGTRLR